MTATTNDSPTVWRDRRNYFKERLAAGEPSMAMWASIPWLPAMEIMGAHGLGSAFIDMEHASLTLREVEDMIIACENAGVSPVVRPPKLEESVVGRILDAGAHGLVFAQIESAEEAEHAVACCRFAPNGVRGWGGSHTRHAMWQDSVSPRAGAGPVSVGSVRSEEYIASAEGFALRILLVETVNGVEDIESIVRVPGVDAVVFGWGDFSTQVRFDKEKADAAGRRVYEACRAAGVGVGIRAGQRGSEEFYPGCFYLIGVDAVLMSEAWRQAILAGTVEAARA